jgi:hypothetical protein
VPQEKHGNKSINGFLTAKKGNKYMTCKRRRMPENKKKTRK